MNTSITMAPVKTEGSMILWDKPYISLLINENVVADDPSVLRDEVIALLEENSTLRATLNNTFMNKLKSWWYCHD